MVTAAPSGLRKAVCTKCFREKELVPRRSFCKECKNAYERKRRAAQSKEKQAERKKKERERYNRSTEDNLLKTAIKIQDDTFLSTLKKCTVCGKTKEVREFHVHKGKDTVRAACRECTSAKRKEYYKNNKVAVNKQTSQYKVEKMKDMRLEYLSVMHKAAHFFSNRGQTISRAGTNYYVHCFCSSQVVAYRTNTT